MSIKVLVGNSPPEKKKASNPLILVGLAAIAVAVGLTVVQRFATSPDVIAFNEAAAKINASTAALQQDPAIAALNQVTLADYIEIAIGMSLADVEQVLGEGTEMSRAEAEGVPTAVVYGWSNPDGSNMLITLQDGVVQNKAQAGLQ